MNLEYENMTESERLISRYLDGELDRQSEADFQRLMADDPAFGEELRQYAALDGRLASMGRDGVEQVNCKAQRMEIMAALERRVLLLGMPRRRLLFVPPMRVMAAMAAAAVLVFATAALMMMSRGGGTDAAGGASPVVAVSVLPETPQGLGKPELDVRMVPIDAAELWPLPETEAGPGGLVTASVGSRHEKIAPGPVEWFEVD